MHDDPKDDSELDLKQLDDPEQPKIEDAEPEMNRADQPEAKPVVGKSAHPYRKWLLLGFLLIVLTLVVAYWLGAIPVSSPGIK
jgi:hypothetical protein